MVEDLRVTGRLIASWTDAFAVQAVQVLKPSEEIPSAGLWDALVPDLQAAVVLIR